MSPVPGSMLVQSVARIRLWKHDKTHSTSISGIDDMVINGLDGDELLLLIHDPGGDYLFVLVNGSVGFISKAMVNDEL